MSPDRGTATVPGPALFARYAYPPNERGLCGPDQAATLLEYAEAGQSDPDLVRLARGFEGAWPYLEILAAAAGVDDPLHPGVVATYWRGGPLADRVPAGMALAGLADGLRHRAPGPAASTAVELVGRAVTGGAPVCHGFHVFLVYPWVGLLRGPSGPQALDVLDRCRIRTGTVVALDGDEAVVEASTLGFAGDRLRLVAPLAERYTVRRAGHGLAAPRVGDVVTLHWDWVCERVSVPQAARIAHDTDRLLAVANAALADGAAPPALDP